MTMTAPNINSFLVIYEIANGLAHIDEFGQNHDEALAAYAEAEARFRDNQDVEVVLIGSDSRATLERTHSSYFELAEKHVDRLIARELADLGLR
jgi:gamma-glutamyl phosphate reductase